MRRPPAFLVIALAAVLLVPGQAAAWQTPGKAAETQSHGADRHSDNMSIVGRFDPDNYASGTDIAFWGKYAVMGSLSGSTGGFRLLDISRPSRPRLVSHFQCPGSQNDVSIWGSLVFLSIDGPRSDASCGSTSGGSWEGIRIVSIADPRNPTLVKGVATDCGSHTHTLVPDLARNRVLVYVLSYPLGAPTATCSAATHRKISVVSVPLSKPGTAKVISTPDVSPAIGCHDVTVFIPRKLAAAACIDESQMWDISDPVNPKVLSHIQNPAINIHHSTAWSWDGDTVVIGDELGGATAAPGCESGGEAPTGALWFYDVSDPSSPEQRSFYSLPQVVQDASLCTAHNFNVIPLGSGRDVLVSAWYEGGLTVVDFTDPSNPTQVGYYIADGVNHWSVYWYNGSIVANDLGSLGVVLYRLTDPAVEGAVRLGHHNPQTQEAIPGVTD